MSDLRIYKYPLELTPDVQTITLPFVDIECVHAGTQDGKTIQIWALIDIEQSAGPHEFYVFPTGQPIPERIMKEGFMSLGPVMLLGGTFIAHVFWNPFQDPEN